MGFTYVFKVIIKGVFHHWNSVNNKTKNKSFNNVRANQSFRISIKTAAFTTNYNTLKNWQEWKIVLCDWWNWYQENYLIKKYLKKKTRKLSYKYNC